MSRSPPTTSKVVAEGPLEKARPFPDAARETVLALHDVTFHGTERLTSVKPDFLPDLTMAPPNNLNLAIGGAVERIFQSSRCQIHHHPPRCGEVVSREKCSPNRKKENPLKRSLQVLSLYLRPGRNNAPSPMLTPTGGSMGAEICMAFGWHPPYILPFFLCSVLLMCFTALFSG